MPAENIDDAKVLVDALRDFGDLAVGMAEPIEDWAERRVFRFAVLDVDASGGGQYQAEISVDIESGKRLLPAIRAMIEARLAELGVDAASLHETDGERR